MADFSGEIIADIWAPTSAFDSGRGGHSVQYIVVHHEAAVGLTAASLSSMWSRMQSQSAHYSVDGDGVIAQHVYERDTAWACGNWTANQSSISIEHANNSTNPWTVSEATLESGAHLVAALLIKYGLGYPRWGGNVRPHKQIVATACPGELAGSQNAHYMERVCYWYEVMTGTRSSFETGWAERDGKRYYFNEQGHMITGWYHDDGDGRDIWYYFDESGALVADCIYDVGAGKLCAFDKDGRLLKGDITVTTNDDGYISGVK